VSGPIRRAPELQPLSRDHHTALLVAHRLLKGLEGRPFAGPLVGWEDLVREALAFDRDHFRAHAEAEERCLVPRLRASAGVDGAAVDRLIADHATLRERLNDATDPNLGDAERRKALTDYAGCLEAHVRFEERELFPAAERALAENDLVALGAELAAYEATVRSSCRIR